MIDQRLRVFLAVANRSSFSLAAQDLYMTQSAVSQHVQSLETHYGIKLFDRLHRRIILTAAGEELYRHGVLMDNQAQEAEKALRNLAANVCGRLHIGASLSIGEYLLPGTLAAFNQLYPDVDIAMEICNTEQIKSLVLNGLIDIGFIEGPVDIPACLESIAYGGDELVIVSLQNLYTDKQPAALEDLLKKRWILREASSGTRHAFEAFLTEQGCDPLTLNIGMELGSTQAIKAAIRAGLGISTLSNFAVTDEIRSGEFQQIPLQEGSILRNFTAITHRDKFLTHAADKFIEFIAKERL